MTMSGDFNNLSVHMPKDRWVERVEEEVEPNGEESEGGES